MMGMTMTCIIRKTANFRLEEQFMMQNMTALSSAEMIVQPILKQE